MGIIKFGYADYQCELPRGELYIPKGHARNEKEILQRSDIARLFEPCDAWYWRAFCFMTITGLRPSECLGIQVGDIEQDCVRIRRAVNSRNYITDGKNRNARRTVPIGATARAILNEIIDRNERMNLHTEWVFCAVDGSHGNQCTMRNQWARLKQERNLPGTLYSFRHTFVSMMKDQLSEAAIKEYIGHSESMDTYGTYGHEVDGEHKKTAEIIDLTFKEFDHNLTKAK
jgi:integrase